MSDSIIDGEAWDVLLAAYNARPLVEGESDELPKLPFFSLVSDLHDVILMYGMDELKHFECEDDEGRRQHVFLRFKRLAEFIASYSQAKQGARNQYLLRELMRSLDASTAGPVSLHILSTTEVAIQEEGNFPSHYEFPENATEDL